MIEQPKGLLADSLRYDETNYIDGILTKTLNGAIRCMLHLITWKRSETTFPHITQFAD